MILKAATEGLGLAFVLEDKAAPLIADGRLDRVLADSRLIEAARRAARACGSSRGWSVSQRLRLIA
jgi:hypothetical protein